MGCDVRHLDSDWFQPEGHGAIALRGYVENSRIHRVVWLVALFSHGFRTELLSRRVFSSSISTVYAGLAITEAGLIFAILARLYVGKNWSALIQVKDGHKLIQTGPYAVVRHPIYSGLMLATLGTAIAYGELGGFLGLVAAQPR